MNNSFKVVLQYGKYHRMWPYTDVNHKNLCVSIGLGRPFSKPLCKVLLSKDYGRSWNEIADFHSMDKRNTTTGQPFITNEGIIFVPVWNASFYTHGRTWFAIYKSEDQGAFWKKVYEDPKGTYANHFFQSPAGCVYIGVGAGGGGYKGRISFSPAQSYLLKSIDLGRTWSKLLTVDYPTALYSGTTVDDKTVLVSAREKKSIFRSVDGCNSWSEIRINNIARSVSYVPELSRFVVTSNSSLFVSGDGLTWIRINAPIKWWALRYPTLYKGKLYMTGDAGHSYVISTDLNKWHLSFDVTREISHKVFARMAIIDDYMFLGGELNGVLLRVKLPIENDKPVDTTQLFETNLRCLISTAKYKIKRVLNYDI